jgi:hypothetical protein
LGDGIGETVHYVSFRPTISKSSYFVSLKLTVYKPLKFSYIYENQELQLDASELGERKSWARKLLFLSVSRTFNGAGKTSIS